MEITVTNTRGTRALFKGMFRGTQIELPVEFNTWAGKCFKQAYGDTVIGFWIALNGEGGNGLIDPSLAVALMYACLEGARIADGKLPKPWNEQDAANIIDETQGGFLAICNGLLPLMIASLPKDNDLKQFPAAQKAIEKQTEKQEGGEAPGETPLTNTTGS